MITLKNKEALEAMLGAGKRLAELFEILKGYIVPGMSTLDIDSYIAQYLQQQGMVSQTVGYAGYKHSSCISINDELVHGVPSAQKFVARGDLVKVDVCASWNSYCADMARCFIVGNVVDEPKMKLIEVAQKSLDAGIEMAVPGGKLTDISYAIQRVVESAGFGVVRDFAGHGIGRKMHESPEILNYGKPGRGPVIREGMAFAIEPMITFGKYDICVDRDGWTARTRDGSLAAHVEDTVLITERGPQVATRV